MGAESSESFRSRSLLASVFVPNLLFAVGQGAVIPIIALLALDLGATPAIAGLIIGLRSLGTLVVDLPAALIIARIGERRSMVVSGAVLAGVSLAIWARPSLPVYAALVTLMGGTWAVWLLARMAYAAGSAPPAHRGRVMAMVGGLNRVGGLVGPLIGSLILIGGDARAPFLILAATSAAAALGMTLSRSPHFVPEPAGSRLRDVVGAHRQTLVTAGGVAIITQVLRSSREVLVPLFGVGVGMDATSISLLFAVSAGIESVMFYPVGMLMDSKGRKWTAIPCIALLSLGMAAFPLVGGVASLAVVVIVLAVANGFGSGMNLTMGSDLSPLVGRSRFLGVWRFITDLGGTGGPVLLAGVTAATSMSVAAVAVGGLGVVGTILLSLAVPETLQRA
jgi:MFS family permease